VIDEVHTGIALAGTGNVAWTLGQALTERGIQVTRVFGRTGEAASSLAKAVGAKEWGFYRPLSAATPMCILAVSDDAIPAVAALMKTPGCLFVHTAGSVPMQVFEGIADAYGVLYPLQTMNKGQRTGMSTVPFLIEANSKDNLEKIRGLALSLSAKVQEASSAARLYYHLAAVLANNFSNHLYYRAEQLLKEQGLSFDLLLPLISETARKVHEIPPEQAQTGPARRGNLKVMEMHLKLLENKPELAEMYRVMSRSILDSVKSEKLKTKSGR
jgi:predicted short-subunit dehydrogenase-like oxidoreductase (DUF2520 family)